MLSLEVCCRIRSSTFSNKTLGYETGHELVAKEGSDFPAWPIAGTTGEQGGKVTKKSNKHKVKTPPANIMMS